MKKIKKILILVVTVIMLSAAMLSFTACGKTDGETITIGVANNTSEVNIVNTLRTAYLKKYPDKKIKIVKINGAFDNALVKLINSKDLPDIIQVYDFSAEYWTSKDIYLPIDSYMTKDNVKKSDYFDSLVDMAQSGNDDKMYWAPRDYNKVVVAVNTDIFKLANVELPKDDWKWSDFVSVCEQLNAKRKDIMSAVGQDIFYPVDANLNWEAVYYPAIKSYGGDILDKEKSTALKNLDGIKEGLDKLMKLADGGLAVEPTATGSPFPSKQSAMSFCVRPNIVSYVNSLKKEDGSVPIEFISLPAFDDASTSYIGMGCTGYALTTQCDESNRDAAWDFLKFIMTEDGQEAFSESGAGIPALKTMAEDGNATFRKYLPNANHDAFVKYQDRDLPMNYMSGYNASKHLAIRQVLTDELTKNLYSAANRDNYYTTLKGKIEAAMK